MPVPRECRFTRLIVDRFNYRSMLVVLVAVYVLYGLLLKSALRDSVLLVTMTLLLVSGILAARPTRTGFWVSASLALAGFVLTALDVLFNHHYHGLWVAGLISYTLFELLTIVILLRSILYVRRVTSEGISAALCVYFLLGLLWTNAYLLLEDLSPGQFDFGNKKTMVAHILENAEQHGYEGAAAERAARHATNGMLLIYLSLTTLTTLGYGGRHALPAHGHDPHHPGGVSGPDLPHGDGGLAGRAARVVRRGPTARSAGSAGTTRSARRKLIPSGCRPVILAADPRRTRAAGLLRS